MSFHNDSTVAVIPERCCKKREYDQDADDPRTDREPGQKRVHYQAGRNGRRLATR